MATAAGFVMLGFGVLIWFYLVYWTAQHARKRGSRLWPAHALGTLAFGIGYIIPYWLVTRS